MKFIVGMVASAFLLLTGALVAWAGPDKPDPSAECRALPRGYRVVKLDLKPDSTLLDSVNLLKTLTCKKVNVTGDISGYRAAIKTPGAVTVDDLVRLVREAAAKHAVQIEETVSSFEVIAGR